VIEKFIILLILLINPVFSSGGYDHGTSTGKGQLELDFTWNPFDLIEFGQSYIVFGYGITDRLDLHGYYAHQTNRQDNYYFGLFYQFLDSKYLDLSTAIGIRQYTISDIIDLFAPQLLYNIKFDQFTLGGAYVSIREIKNNSLVDRGGAFDISLYIPLSNALKLPKPIEEVKIALGLFNPGVFDSDHGEFLPTYSIDITFKKLY
jgi:hypothetical protein